MKKLRIAFLPHLGRPITRYTRAARARVMYDLIFELSKKGHSLYIIGTADTKTPATTIPVAPTGVFMMKLSENDFYRHTSYVTRALKTLENLQDKFDLVHNHMYPEFMPYLLGPQLKIPMLTTVHTEMNDYLVDALKTFKGAQLVALSEKHKADAKGLKIPYVVHNGINMDAFPFSPKHKDYLLFVGRIKIVKKEDGSVYDPKGVLTAISVAKKTKQKLLISGSIENKAMYEHFIKPHLSKQIQLVGGVSNQAPLSQEEIAELYRGAKALLFPINWQEPFGLVIVEANAAGTPVIAMNRGAVPELIHNGVNGYVVETEKEMIQALTKIEKIDRKKCHEAVEIKFARSTMADNYEKLYYELVS